MKDIEDAVARAWEKATQQQKYLPFPLAAALLAAIVCASAALGWLHRDYLSPVNEVDYIIQRTAHIAARCTNKSHKEIMDAMQRRIGKRLGDFTLKEKAVALDHLLDKIEAEQIRRDAYSHHS